MRLGKNIFQAAFFRFQVSGSKFQVSGSRFEAISHLPSFKVHAISVMLNAVKHLYTSAVGRCVIIHFLDADDADDADLS